MIKHTRALLQATQFPLTITWISFAVALAIYAAMIALAIVRG